MTADLLSFLKSHNMPVPPEVVKTPVRVMIVDDDPEVAKVIAQAIAVAHPDYEVTEVHDGFKAGAIAATISSNISSVASTVTPCNTTPSTNGKAWPGSMSTVTPASRLL